MKLISIFTGLSFNGRTFALQARNKGSIPFRSIRIEEELKWVIEMEKVPEKEAQSQVNQWAEIKKELANQKTDVIIHILFR